MKVLINLDCQNSYNAIFYLNLKQINKKNKTHPKNPNTLGFTGKKKIISAEQLHTGIGYPRGFGTSYHWRF